MSGKLIASGLKTVKGNLLPFGGDNQMAKNEKTSSRIGKLASKALRDLNASKREKSLAGSVLTQRPDRNRK